jgi:Cytochrome c oxidase subunit IV
MKPFVGLFASTALFAVSICVIYWFSSHDRGGALLLGFMCIALAFAAAYAFYSEKNAALEGDDPNLQHKEAAGEDITIVTKESPWPLILACSIVWMLIGLLWSDFMLFTGLAAILLALWRLGAESARAGEERIVTEEGPETFT